MTLSNYSKQNSAISASQRYISPTAARATGPTGKPGAAGRPNGLERLARPTRKTDFYLGEEGSEPVRHASAIGGLSTPKANASRNAQAKALPAMDAAPQPTVLPKVEAPRALKLEDVSGNAETLAHLGKQFDLVTVHGDSFASLVAALLHHGASNPARAGQLADGLRSFEEPIGETSNKVAAGYAMIKRWAQALQDGRGADAKNDALKHPDAIAAIALAMRGIVRHMQVFGSLKRPAKTGHAADLDAMQALASACGLKLAAHGADSDASLGDGTLHVLKRGAGHLDVLVPKA